MSRNSTNSHRDRLSDRGDAMLPETEMQLEMILTKASETSRKAGDGEPQVLVNQSKLIILEDRFTVMQKRNVVLIAENEALRSQLRESTAEIGELKETRNLMSEGGEVRRTSTTGVEDRGIATMDFLETMERGVQTCLTVCRSSELKFEIENSIADATTIMDTSEVGRLEKDVRRLRDVVASRESDWDKAIDRENCYREQLKRLTAETMTCRQLSDARHAELERLAQTLAETEKDLRSARKEISALKKIIAKQDKRRRELGEKWTDCRVDEAQTSPLETHDKEPEWIDDIVKQLSGPSSGKQGSRLSGKDRAIYTSGGTNLSGDQASPRS